MQLSFLKISFKFLQKAFVSSNKFKPWTLEARKPVKSKQNGGSNHVEYSDLNSCLLPNDTISAEITQEERIEVGEDALKKELENSGISVTACNDGTCILPGRMATGRPMFS